MSSSGRQRTSQERLYLLVTIEMHSAMCDLSMLAALIDVGGVNDGQSTLRWSSAVADRSEHIRQLLLDEDVLERQHDFTNSMRELHDAIMAVQRCCAELTTDDRERLQTARDLIVRILTCHDEMICRLAGSSRGLHDIDSVVESFRSWDKECTTPCPFCGEPLRTPRARQCRHCGRDWHVTM